MIRLYIYAGLAVAAGVALAYGTHRVYQAGADSVRVEWAAANAQATAAAIAVAEKRAEAIKEIDHAATVQTRRVSADRVAAAVAGGGLRFRADAVGARCDTPSESASPGPSASAPGSMLADVLGRLEEAGRELAATADERGTAGAACERAYDSLK